MPEAPGQYLLQQNRADTLFTGTGLALRLAPPERPVRELHWGLAGARSVTPQPLQPREARLSQFVGSRENWKQHLPTWGALYYPGVAPGVDLWFEAREGGIAYSLRSERGADLRQVRLEWRGAQALRLADGGRALEVVLAEGVLREEGLLCGQEAADGTSLEVPCRYREVRPLGAERWEYVIEVEVKEPGRPAWVDPTIKWNTYVGGSNDDTLRGLTVINNDSGLGFIVGSTNSPALAPKSPADRASGSLGMSNVIVSKFNNDGTLLWTTVFGGNGDDIGNAVAVGADGLIYVAGHTASTDFQVGTTGSRLNGTAKDGFVAALVSNTGELNWFQHVGDTGAEEIHSLAFANDGKLYVAGWTLSTQMTGTPAGTTFKGNKELFVSRLAVTATSGTVEKTLIRSGTGDEDALGIVAEEQAPSSTAMLYVTGYTTSTDFPTATGQPAMLPGLGNNPDTVVFKLDQDLTLVWGNFIGGLGEDKGNGLVHAPLTVISPYTSRVMVVGTTNSINFPSSTGEGASGKDAFLATFNPDTGVRVFSTVVGGSKDDEGLAIATGSAGSVYVGGKSKSGLLPSTEAFESTPDVTEGFVIRMRRNGDEFSPEWGSFVGGALDDEVGGLASRRYSNGDYELFIGGSTHSDQLLRFPMVPGLGGKTSHSGAQDMFLITIDAKDFTPPEGEVLDGIGQDLDETAFTDMLSASWTLDDPESAISDYLVAVGTAPGCTDIRPFKSVGQFKSITMSSANGDIRPLTGGQWYFVTVSAKNGRGVITTRFSDGIFVRQSDGGPIDIPPAPLPGTPCPEEPGTDGGTADGGVTDGGTSDGGTTDGGDPGTGPDGGGGGGGPGHESPLGWSCGTPGGPTGFVLLVVAAFGFLSARRKSWS
ncbi:DUF7948 domain-containing protein [Archangium lansingense]|uniref:DUF7948 domain-containing protein n=1 Tax=Archangium lansingense TaxID=2995310 RepID=A0ABT4A2R1_9BACT|nr:hypothetical protein [Archangium lansinium]MCY1075931.1 hypothetical protein [Archangium lansinium]